MTAVSNAPGRNGFKYQERYGVIVLCEDAADQKTIFEKLKNLGFDKLKVVTV
jgi:hypothetical protein